MRVKETQEESMAPERCPLGLRGAMAQIALRVVGLSSRRLAMRTVLTKRQKKTR